MTQQTDFSMMPQPGEVIAGRYEITALIGRGGGGVVYRATQLGINRDVAVKILPPEHQLHAAAVRRFEREARLVSRLRHPNTVTLYEYNRTQSGLLYIVMEFVDGVPLKDVLLQQRIIPPERAVPVLRQILKSLAEAHSHGIVHRDLKPANIMLCNMYGEPDFVKVLDFGVATALEGDESKYDEDVTTTADVVGTPRYMAPEQFRSEQLTPASDLYALSCIAFEMLSGYCPFDGETLHVTIAKHLFQPAPKLPVELERFPVLVGLIEQLLSKKPAERLQRAEDVLLALENWDGIPGDRTIKAPSPKELLSLIEQHQQAQQHQHMYGGAPHMGGHHGVDDYTGSVPPQQVHNTFTGYPSNLTPNQPLGPNTHHGLVLDDAHQPKNDRRRVILAAAIGVLTLVALAVFIGIRLSGDDDSSNTAEAAPEPESPEVAPIDLGEDVDPTPLLDGDALERSVRLHDIGSRIGVGGHAAAISGAMMTAEIARRDADAGEDEPDDTQPAASPQPRSNNVAFKIRYEPPSAAVRVNGAPASCSGGKCRMRGKIGDTFDIQVRAMGFKPYKTTVTADRGMRDVRIKLEPMR